MASSLEGVGTMAQNKNRPPQQLPRIEEQPDVVVEVPPPNDRNIPYIRFAFGVWVAVFSLLALSVIWDSIYGLLLRSPPA